MLHERIQLAIGLIEDVVDNRQKENENNSIASKNTTFFNSYARLTPSITSYILAKKNFNFNLQSNTDDCLQYLMSYLETTFENAKATNPPLFKQKSEAFIDSITKEWNAFYKENNSEIIDGLNIIVLVHPNPVIVRSCILAFNKCAKWPLSQESIDSYKDARKKADELLKEMRFDDEISDFLIKVRDKKATLTDITPSILEWIQSENIADKISLRIQNTN